ncbi:MAG TPA: hypothetical protein VMT52_17070 [Planctomycetota bacterium]|nr:hypothetical protein [Planctomycetota bacterium]
MRFAAPFLFLAGLSASMAFPFLDAGDAREGPSMVIVQPGYPGSTEDARGFVAELCAHVGRKADLAGLAGAYHNEEKPALAAIEKERPAFGVVSVGFYLEHRKELGLQALLQTKPRDTFVVVARAGDVKGLEGLKGESVAGGPLHERKFLERIVFWGKADVSAWSLQPTLRASRALRDLVDRKKHRAVILVGRDHRALSPLYPGKTLEKLHESEYYPPAFLVAFRARGAGKADPGPAPSGDRPPGDAARGDGKGGGDGRGSPDPEKPGTEELKTKNRGEPRSAAPENARPQALSEETLRKVQRAFAGLAQDPAGKGILETMGAEGFEEIPAEWLHDLEGRYDAADEKK